MKAVYIAEPWSIEVKDIEQRKPRADEALLKVHSAGICGSDLGAFKGTSTLFCYPGVIGHELACEVLEVPEDPELNPNGLHVGDRVVVDPYTFCGTCYPCSVGKRNCCNNIKVAGVHIDGGMSETFAHPAFMLNRIPDGLDYQRAAMAEPLTIALHAIHRARLKAGEYVVVFGAGPIGMLVAMAALAYDATPILTDIVSERLDYARKLGVRYTVDQKSENLLDRVLEITNGEYAQCAIDASGAYSAIRSSIEVVCHAGRISFTGWPKGETPIPTDQIMKKELDVFGVRNSLHDFDEALELISTGKVDVAKIITKVVSIDDAPETVRDIEKNPGNYLKVVVNVSN